MKKIILPFIVFLCVVNTLNAQYAIVKNDTIFIENNTLTLKVENVTNGKVNWESSIDNITWQQISNSNENSWVLSVDKTSYYRAAITDGDCDPYYSDVTYVVEEQKVSRSAKSLVLDENTPITLLGYTDKSSYMPGKDTVDFFIGDSSGRGVKRSKINISIIRRGKPVSLSFKDSITQIELNTTGPEAWKNGCNWTKAFSFPVTSDWPSGMYTATVTADNSKQAEIPFIIKSQEPSDILVVLPTSTYLAYNKFGGGSLYTGKTSVHYQRPLLLSPSPGDLDDFLNWIYYYNNGKFANKVSFAASFDLHEGYAFLDQHKTIISPWHDEYWSWEMRDNVEGFIANGGSAFFMSGNTCWWQVRFREHSNGGLIMDCFKEEEDPFDNTRLDTTNWVLTEPPRPESIMVGVSTVNAAQWPGNSSDKSDPEYIKNWSAHWVYKNTNAQDTVFGKYTSYGIQRTIVGYETDAKDNYTPENFITFAYADNIIKPNNGWKRIREFELNYGDPNRVEPIPNAITGKAHMGFYRRNGLVFASGSIDWKAGLGGLTSIGGEPYEKTVSTITENVLDMQISSNKASELALNAPFKQIPNKGFERWSGSSINDWYLEGVGTISKVPKANGNHSLQIDATAGDTWINYDPLIFNKSKNYRVGCWAKTISGNGLSKVHLQSNDTINGNLARIDFVSSNGTNSRDWDFICGIGTSNNGENGTFNGRVKIFVPAGNIVQFDDVIVEDMSKVNHTWRSGIEIPNGDFSQAWHGPGIAPTPESWNPSQGPGPATEGGGGTAYIRGSNGITNFSQNLSLNNVLEKNAYYLISAKVHCTVAGKAKVKIQRTDGTIVASATCNVANQWTYIWAVGRIQDANASALFPAQVVLEVDGPGNDIHAHFDDISLRLIGSTDSVGNLK